MLKAYLTLPRATHMLCIGAFINRAGTFVVPFLTIYLQSQLGLGSTFATLAIGVYGAGAFGALLTGGHLADQIGRKIVMLISLLGAALLLVLLGYLRTPWAILMAIFCFALIAEMYRPAAMALLADVNRPDQRSRAFSEMYVAINLGFAIAATVGGLLSHYSFVWLFWGDALTAVLGALIIFLAVPETLPKRTTAVQRKASEREADIASPPPMPFWSALGYIMKDRCFIAYWFGSLLMATTYLQSMSTFPLYLTKLGIDAAVYGRIIGLNGLMIVCLQLPTTSLVSRYRRGHVIVFSALIVGLGIGSIGLASVPWQFALVVMAWTAGEMMNFPSVSALIGDLAPAHMRARYMGIYSIGFSMAMMLGAPAGGLILSRFGGRTLWSSCAVLGSLAACCYWIGSKLFDKRSASAASSSPNCSTR